MKKQLLSLTRHLTCLVLLSGVTSSFAQERYTIRKDPKNAKRSIIDLTPVIKKANLIQPTKNALDVAHFQRPPIAFKPFEMKNPKTGKALNPSSSVTIKMADGKTKKTTVKQFFDELNEMEKALAAKGRTLRVPSTFVDLRPNFSKASYTKVPKLNPGFRTKSFEVASKRINTGNLQNPGKLTVSNGGLTNTNFPTATTSGNTGNVASRDNSIIKTSNNAIGFDWKANLYIALRFSDHGHPEFPAEWVKTTLISKGRTVFPIIVQVPKVVEGLVKRIDWQVSDKPFDNTLKDVNVPGVKKSGTVSPITWAIGFRGTSSLPNNLNYKYAALYIDLSQVEPEPVNAVKPYYIRTLCYDQSGELLEVSSQVMANYGGIDKPFKIAIQEVNTVPGFNYQFPDAGTNLPFGVFVKGSGLNSRKPTKYIDDKFEKLITTGYRLSANASLGVKYFNFLSLVDGNEPLSKDLTILKGDFRAVLGLGTGPSGQNEDQGIKLTVTVLDGMVPPYEIGFSQPIPELPNTISLEYDIVEDIDIGLLDMRFLIGPVPVRIAAGIKGQTGLKLFGKANTSTFEVTGGVKPFMNTRFEASGGVDAVIAYATLNADVNPLLSIDMPLTFTSGGGKPLSFSTNISGLSGRIYLKVGFWYPCPDLEKVVGWLTGDEDTPLCECKWEYNIFDFAGFNHSYSY